MRKKSKSFCRVDHLELRRLLSTIYVSANATGTHNGSSWATAYTDLQQALAVATSGTTIEVGQGTYKPSADTSETATFQLIDHVSIQGGYAGTGASNPDARNVTNFLTILSGDLGTVQNPYNSYHVVTGSGTNATAVLDGFTITGGNANESNNYNGGGILNVAGSPTINDCIITSNIAKNSGGGIANLNGSSPILTACTISGNSSETGGGVYNYASSPTLSDSSISSNTGTQCGGIMSNHNSSATLTDCTLTGNTSISAGGGGVGDFLSSATLTDCSITGNNSNTGGGITDVHSTLVLTGSIVSGNTSGSGAGIYENNSSATITNCTITGNSTGGHGGGISSHLSTVTVTNSLLWNNSSLYVNEKEISKDATSTVTITYSDVEDTNFVGATDVDADPMFVRNAGTNGASDFGDLHLQGASPVINSGSNSAIVGVATDVGGNPRIVGGIVDMGAYEYQTALPIFVDHSATGTGTGVSWANAFTSLQTALKTIVGGATIEVAQGTYKPTTGTDKTATFQLQSGVTLEGGFAGDTTSNPSTRNISLYPVILSGDIGAIGFSSDNSYNVVTGSGADSTAVLDGFIIIDGNAASSSANGGGILNVAGSPTISHCTITGNTATGSGGGISNSNGSSPTLLDCTISGNVANGDGAGIADQNNSSPTLVNCAIIGNDTSDNGGGVANGNASSPMLINCTIAANGAGRGGGMYSYDNSHPTVTNSILWANGARTGAETGQDSTSTVTITFSDVENTSATGAGNMDVDPFFINTNQSDYQIEPYSPVVDAGNNSAVPNGVTTDLLANNRFQNVPTSSHHGSGSVPIVDMGAYEAAPALAASTGGPYVVIAGHNLNLTGFGSSTITGALSYSWDLNGDGIFGDATGADPVFSTLGQPTQARLNINLKVTDASNEIVTASGSIQIAPAILYVDAHATGANNGLDWADAYTSLTSALSVAVSGETVDVAQGTYKPTTQNFRFEAFALTDGVSIEGGFAGDTTANAGARDVSLYPTILSGDIGTIGNNSDNSYHVVTDKYTDSTALLDGFEITGGNATVSSGDTDPNGGGIFNYYGNATINDCTITGNTASDFGGGIYCDQSSPTLTNCTISDNTAKGGGGLQLFVHSSPTLTDCIITGNTATLSQGGGLYDRAYSSPTLTDCIITSNTAENDGGAMFNTQNSSPTLIGSVISGNSARAGGGLYNNLVSATLTNCTISGNTSRDAGGGIYNFYSSPTLTNTVISGNSAHNGGGAMANYDSSPMLINCTISGNSAHNGAGLYNVGNGITPSAPTVINSIFWGDTATGSGNEVYDNTSGSVTITYSDIDQSGFTSTGDKDADPKFVRAVGANGTSDPGDLRLQISSTAINAGLNSAVTTSTDVDGISRIAGASVDMGAYESHWALQQNIFVDASATGTNDGSSWANAYTSLSVALQYTVSGETISVAQGTYKPTADTNRLASFELVNGVSIEGGFAGDTTSTPTARNVSLYPTILSGDIGTAGNNSDNSYHVVTALNGVNATAVLNGFTITDGNADGIALLGTGGGIETYMGSPTINDCIITGNAGNLGGGIGSASSSMVLTQCTITGNTAESGGGINDYESSSTLLDCIITGNTASQSGGGISEFRGASTLTNCIISGNTSTGPGGAIANSDASPTLLNCTISGNRAASGGGIYSVGESGFLAAATLTNCILWGDTASTNTEIHNGTFSTVTATYSDIDQAGFTAIGDLDADPIFVRNPGTNGSTDFGDLHLQGASPIINAGSNAAITGVSTDLDGNPRIIGSAVDIGALESLATKLAMTTPPASSTAAGTAVSVVVDVEDQNGNIITDDNSNVIATVLTGPTGASLGGAFSVAAQNGVATFSDLILTKAGTYTLAFSQGSLAAATTNTFTITPGSPASLSITHQPVNTIAGQTMPAVDVEVEDQFGNLVDGSSVSVAIASNPSGVSLVGITPQSTTGGVAAFTDLSLPTAGSYTLVFSDGSLPGVTSTSFDIAPAAAAKLAFITEPANATAGQTLSAFAIEVEDQFGNLATSDASTVSLSSTPSGASTSVAADLGVAVFSNLSITTAGLYTLTATDGSLISATSSSFTITPAAPASLIITTQPISGTAGQTLSPVSVKVEDQYGNLTDGTSVTLAVASGPSGAMLSGTLALATSGGIATFNNLSLSQAGAFTLSASDGSLSSVTSNSFTLSYAGPTLIFSAEPSSATAGGKLPAFTVETVNTTGNLITTGKSKIQLALSSGGKFIGSTNAAVKAGKGIFSKLSIQKAGTYTITATDPTFASAISTTFTISAGAASKLVFTPQPPTQITHGTPFSADVQLFDKYGNLATNNASTVELTLGSRPHGATFNNLMVTVTDGSADFDIPSLTVPGSYSLDAIDGKLKTKSGKIAVE